MASNILPNQEPKWVPPIPTPTYGPGGSVSITFSTTIAASPTACMDLMLDTSTYPNWNRFCRQATIDKPSNTTAAELPASLSHLAAKPQQQMLLPGAQFHFDVYMDPDSAAPRRVDLEVSVLEEFERDGRRGLRVAWQSLGDPWYLHAERVQEFLETAEGSGECEYSNCETFYGLIGAVPKMFVGGKLEKALGLWRDGLKGEVEARAKGETS